MPQTTLSVVLEVAPESAKLLSKIIERVRCDEETLRPGDTELYSRLKWGVPSLHFMSMSVFQGADYDPIFVIEANFDGLPGPFWAQLEATLGSNLQLMLRCCKRPADSSGPLYDAVAAPGASYPIAPYFERKTLTPSSLAQIQRPQNVPLVENRWAVPTWRPPTNNRGPSRLTILRPPAESIRMSLNVVPDNRGRAGVT
jgi:hypothetical protein